MSAEPPLTSSRMSVASWPSCSMMATSRSATWRRAYSRELAAATEVGECDAAVGQREEVAGVRVGVEEAVHEDLLVVADDAFARRRLAVDHLAVELVEPVERDADDALLA